MKIILEVNQEQMRFILDSGVLDGKQPAPAPAPAHVETTGAPVPQNQNVNNVVPAQNQNVNNVVPAQNPAVTNVVPAQNPAVTNVATHGITIDEVRAALAPLLKQGKMAEMQQIFAQFNAAKLTDIPVEQYPNLLNAINAMFGGQLQ